MSSELCPKVACGRFEGIPDRVGALRRSPNIVRRNAPMAPRTSDCVSKYPALVVVVGKVLLCARNFDLLILNRASTEEQWATKIASGKVPCNSWSCL